MVFFGVLACLLALNMVTNVSAIPNLISCNAVGGSQYQFSVGESVFASGYGFNSYESLTIYVLPNGVYLDSTNAIRKVTTNANASGYLNPTNLGTFDVGYYDIWADRNNDGEHDPMEPIDTWGCTPGFFVIPEYWLGSIMGLLGCFAAFGMFHVSKQKRLQ